MPPVLRLLSHNTLDVFAWVATRADQATSHPALPCENGQGNAAAIATTKTSGRVRRD